MDDLLSTARAAADAAVRAHRRHAGRTVLAAATVKARADYVSQADLDAQAAALEVIRSRYPDHAHLAEESEDPVEVQLEAWDGRPLWVVDPLDGTTNFLHTHPHYCASVAVAVDGRPVAGAVTHGTTGERWWAASGKGAYLNGRRLHVSSARGLNQALVGTGFPFKLIEALPEYTAQLDRVLRASSGVRRAGTAALDLCYLAQGSLDAFWEEILMPWDFAAGWIIVDEAGGLLARPDGSELNLEPGPVRGANTPELLEQLRDVLED